MFRRNSMSPRSRALLTGVSLACLLAGASRLNASPFLSVQFDASTQPGDETFTSPGNLQAGFLEFAVGGIATSNLAGPLTAGNTYVMSGTTYSTTSNNAPFSVSDPQVAGSTVGVSLAAGDAVNGSGYLDGTGNITERWSVGYSSTYSKLYGGYITASNTSSGTVPTALQLTGLIAGDSYSVTIFAADGHNYPNGGAANGPGVDSSVYPSTADGTTGTSGSIAWLGTDDGTEYQFSTTLTLTPNSNGIMTIDILGNATGNDWGIIDGFQIADAPAPEPSMLGLLGIAALPIFALRRRRRLA